jgi:hypothetical protein
MRSAMRAISQIDREIWLLLGLSAFAWLPLLTPGYFLNAHDAPHTVFFLRQFDQTLRDGFLIPRWGTDFALGYGYPLFLFYSPLAYYVAESFHLLGAGLTLALKLTYVVAFIGSGLTMYLLGRRLFGRSAGLLAGVLYVYMPYHLVDVYVRCDLTESFAYVFLPLTIWAFGRLVECGGRRNLAWAAASYAGLILAHNSTALVFTPFLMAYIVFLLFRIWRAGGWQSSAARALGAIAGALLGGALSAFFLLPALLEQQFIVQEQWIQGSFNYLRHFVFPAQLFSPLWGFGYAGEGLADDMSFQLGLISATFSVLAVTVGGAITRRRGDRNFLILATLAVVFFMLPASAFLWQLLPMAALVQFPWRLLIVTSVSLALLGGSLATGIPHPHTEKWSIPVFILGLIVVLGSFSYTLPEYTEHSTRSEESVAVIDFELVYPPDRTGMMAWTQEQPMTSPLVPQYLAGEPLMKAHIVDGDASVEMIRHGGASEEIRVRAATPATVEFYTYYFPGWTARMDGQEVDIRPSGTFGLIALDVPAGEHHISLRFGDTPVRIVGKVISLVSLALLGWLIYREKRSPDASQAKEIR